MIAKVSLWTPERSSGIGIHRTYLNSDGSGKADVTPNKMMWGAINGGSVQLEPAGEMLALAEGVETALSVYQMTGLPTWAGLSAGGIKGLVLPVLPLAQCIYIFADHDPVGLKAADEAANKWVYEGRTIKVIHPPDWGQDFNDVLMKGIELKILRQKCVHPTKPL